MSLKFHYACARNKLYYYSINKQFSRVHILFIYVKKSEFVKLNNFQHIVVIMHANETIKI